MTGVVHGFVKTARCDHCGQDVVVEVEPVDVAVLEAGPFRLNVSEARFFIDGRAVPLPKAETQIMAAFMRHPGHVYGFSIIAQLLADVSPTIKDPSDYANGSAADMVRQRAHQLRRRLGDHARHITTVIGHGYRLDV